MAKVQVQVAGGEIQQIEADTVDDAKKQVGAANYTAAVNGEPADNDYELSDYEFVSFAKPVKAG